MSKEWKCNSASFRSMLGINKNCTTSEREATDYYSTDTTAVEQFVKHITKTRGLITGSFFNTIWEPACGCGNISKVLQSHGYEVISSDLHDRGFGFSGFDFLDSVTVPERCNTIITNPPYSLANEFILHAMDVLPKGGRYFALMNLSYLTGQNRFKEIYNNGYLYSIHVYPHRINCYKNNEDQGQSSPVNYAWFEFLKFAYRNNRPQHFPPKIYWIEK